MENPRRFFQVAKLSEVARGRDNNLNLIRFVCASAVIVSHSWVLLGALDPAQTYLRSCNLGDIAVRSFFFLSGYLILKSGMSGSDVEEFLAARVLRIFPGIIVAVLVCAFVMGPLVSSLPVRDYFLHPGTWNFLREMVLNRTQESLPGVFAQGHLFSPADGVFWTLPVEWTMYIAVLVLCLVVRGKTFWGKSPIRTILITLAAFGLTIQMMPLADRSRVRSCIFYFVFGATCYLLRKWILLSLPAALLLLVTDIVLIGFHGYEIGTRLFPLALGYMLLTFGFHPAALVRSFHRFGDYSYGLYIYAFPIQQLNITYIHESWMLFALSYPPSLLAAVLSWHFIEKPCLSIKDRLKRSRKVVRPEPERVMQLVQNEVDSTP
jgi:peptidoglycan/LPS O-acetylase OafA/YrhL